MILFPGGEVALDDLLDDFSDAFEIAPAGARQHHPCENQRLSHVPVGGVGK